MATKLILLVAASLLLAACNTFQGMGKDIQRAGESIEKASKRN